MITILHQNPATFSSQAEPQQERERLAIGWVQVSNLMFYARSLSKAVSGRRLIPNETFIISNGTQPLMTRGTSWCKWGPLLSSECWIRLKQLMSVRHITVIWMLNQAPTADVNEAHYCHLNAESGSNSWCKWGPLLSSECWIRFQQLM